LFLFESQEVRLNGVNVASESVQNESRQELTFLFLHMKWRQGGRLSTEVLINISYVGYTGDSNLLSGFPWPIIFKPEIIK
jgi:hypothetical protein